MWCGQPTKFVLHVSNVQLNTQNEELVSMADGNFEVDGTTQHFFLWWCISSARENASSLLGFLDHKQLNTHTLSYPVELLWISDRPVAEAATCTMHNKHKGQTSMPSAGFQTAIPAMDAYAADLRLRRQGHRAGYNTCLVHQIRHPTHVLTPGTPGLQSCVPPLLTRPRMAYSYVG
jgi:hypothetical protein